MKSNYDILGKYVTPVDTRNKDLGNDYLLGVSISKKFIPSIANTVGTDFSAYKIVKKGQFAYGPVTSRNGDKISIALLDDNDCIISSSYSVFEVIDKRKLLPEYLMLWFRRPEFDRYARYMSHGSVREIFGWDEMCKIELPVPDIAEQWSIVESYNTIENRINLLKEKNDNLEATAQAIYQSWFIDFEPFEVNETGIPTGWAVLKLSDIANASTNSINPRKLACSLIPHYSIPAFDSSRLPIFDNPDTILSNKYIVAKDSILLSKLNPDTKRIWRTIKGINGAICSTEFVVINAIFAEHRDFLYMLFNAKQFVDFLVSNATGSTNSRMRVKPTSTLDYEFACPPESILSRFCSLITPMLDIIEVNLLEIQQLQAFNVFLPSQLMISSGS